MYASRASGGVATPSQVLWSYPKAPGLLTDVRYRGSSGIESVAPNDNRLRFHKLGIKVSANDVFISRTSFFVHRPPSGIRRISLARTTPLAAPTISALLQPEIPRQFPRIFRNRICGACPPCAVSPKHTGGAWVWWPVHRSAIVAEMSVDMLGYVGIIAPQTMIQEPCKLLDTRARTSYEQMLLV